MSAYKTTIWIVVLFTIIELINLLTGRLLNQFGNVPRQLTALPGILLSPLLHGSLMHFLSNIVPIALFSFLLIAQSLHRYVKISLFIVIVTGILVWCFGRNAVHVGASGLIYGHFCYLALAGFLSGRLKQLGISLLVLFFYGGMIWGVLPGRPFVSWESHLFGFLSGLIAAKLWAGRDNN
jgi:membrane associated rhomboid family serine protease